VTVRPWFPGRAAVGRRAAELSRPASHLLAVPLLERDLHAGSVELGLTSTVFLWVYGILSPFAGYLADRFGRVRVIVFSLMVWSVVTWMTAHAATISQLLATRALMGVSEAFYLPAALALIVEAHGERSRSLPASIRADSTQGWFWAEPGAAGWESTTAGDLCSRSSEEWVSDICCCSGFFLRPAANRQRTAAQPPRFVSSLARLIALPGFARLALVFTIFGVSNWIVYTWLPLYLYERFGMSLTGRGILSHVLHSGGELCRDCRRRMARRPLQQLQRPQPRVDAIPGTGNRRAVSVPDRSNHLTRAANRRSGDIRPRARDIRRQHHARLSQIAPAELRATGYGIFNMASCLVGGIGAAAAGSLKPRIGLSAAFELSGLLLIGGSFLLFRMRIEQPACSEASAAPLR